MVLTKEEKKAIEGVSIWLYQMASDNTTRIHNKEEFFTELKRLVAIMPITQGYGDASKVLSLLDKVQQDLK